MDRWLKILIGAACICVIGLTAHYAYGVYQQRQEADRLDAKIAKEAKEKTDTAIREAEQRTAEATAALEAECSKRVPSQSTDNLKDLYKRCLTDNAGLFGVPTP